MASLSSFSALTADNDNEGSSNMRSPPPFSKRKDWDDAPSRTKDSVHDSTFTSSKPANDNRIMTTTTTTTTENALKDKQHDKRTALCPNITKVPQNQIQQQLSSSAAAAAAAAASPSPSRKVVYNPYARNKQSLSPSPSRARGGGRINNNPYVQKRPSLSSSFSPTKLSNNHNEKVTPSKDNENHTTKEHKEVVSLVNNTGRIHRERRIQQSDAVDSFKERMTTNNEQNQIPSPFCSSISHPRPSSSSSSYLASKTLCFDKEHNIEKEKTINEKPRKSNDGDVIGQHSKHIRNNGKSNALKENQHQHASSPLSSSSIWMSSGYENTGILDDDDDDERKDANNDDEYENDLLNEDENKSDKKGNYHTHHGGGNNERIPKELNGTNDALHQADDRNEHIGKKYQDGNASNSLLFSGDATERSNTMNDNSEKEHNQPSDDNNEKQHNACRDDGITSADASSSLFDGTGLFSGASIDEDDLLEEED